MPNLTASIAVSEPTEVRVTDRPYGTAGHRVTTVDVEGLTIHVGIGDDWDTILAADNLIDALAQLRDAARDRIAAQEKATHEAADRMLSGGYVPSYDDLPDVPLALTPDPGDHYIRPGESINVEGEPAFNGALNRW